MPRAERFRHSCDAGDDDDDDDDDRTTLVSVSSQASWGSDSPFTAALRVTRADGLRRLRRAEARFREQVETRERALTRASAAENTAGKNGDGGVGGRGTGTGTGRAILSYEDIPWDELERGAGAGRGEVGAAEQERLVEALVRAVLVRRGYRIVGEAA